MKTDDDMREYVSQLDMVANRLDSRDSFFGGRVNAIKFYHEIKDPGETRILRLYQVHIFFLKDLLYQ